MNRPGLLLALALTLFGSAAGAQSATSDASKSQEVSPLTAEQEKRAAAISRQTMSPFCPGRTLADCPSGYATEWRADIREMVGRGMSASEIQRELEGRAGGNLSGSPHRESGYGLSIFFALLAVSVLGAVLLRLRGSSSALPAASPGSASEQGSASTAGKGKARPASTPKTMVDDARLDAELAAEDEGPID